jgi:prevent-host-death family protein
MNVAVYEAKSKLSELLDKVCAGKEVVITSHGEPIARLVPMNAPAAPDRARAVREVRALSKRLNIRAGISLRKLIEEGRD